MQFEPGEINIVCSNIEASMHFYRDVLRLELLEREAERFRFGAATLLLLPIAPNRHTRWEYGDLPEISLDLQVDDIVAAREYLREHAVEIVLEWQPGRRSFVIRDPDGLVLEIVQRPPSRNEPP